MSPVGWHFCAPALAASALLAGCGGATSGGSGDREVARVGGVSITHAELTRRMAALAPEGVPDAPRFARCVSGKQAQLLVQAPAAQLRGECAQQYAALQHRALGSLIADRWLVGEAAERGVLPHVDAASDSQAATARLAEGRLRELAAARAPRVGRAQALAYYRANVHRYERHELRYVDLAENFDSAATAAAAKRRIEAGGAGAGLPLHEVVERFNTTGRVHTTEAGKRAIFSAGVGVVGGPVKLTDRYALFEVVRIVPPARRPFAAVERSIVQRLEREQRRRSLSRFIAAWRAKWRARTVCSPGYVVQTCRNYAGTREREDPLAFA